MLVLKMQKAKRRHARAVSVAARGIDYVMRVNVERIAAAVIAGRAA